MEIMARSVLCLGLCIFLSVGTCLARCNGRRTKLKPDERIQNLTLPSYPSEYAENMVCKWTIYHVYGFRGDILLKILDLDIEKTTSCENDSLTLYGYDEFRQFRAMSFCGSDVPNETYYFGGAVSIVFRSNNQFGGRGFLLQYNKPEYEEYDDDHDRDGRGYSDGWGGVLVVVCVVVGVVLVVLLVGITYCHRRRKTELKEIPMSNIYETEKSHEETEKSRDEIVKSRDEPEDVPNDSENVLYI